MALNPIDQSNKILLLPANTSNKEAKTDAVVTGLQPRRDPVYSYKLIENLRRELVERQEFRVQNLQDMDNFLRFIDFLNTGKYEC